MPSVTIKSMPEKLYRSLKRSARHNHRSLNGEAIACLERSLGMTRPLPRDMLRGIDSLRGQLTSITLTDRILRRAKSEGRP